MKKTLRKSNDTGILDTYSVLRYCACETCACTCKCGWVNQAGQTFDQRMAYGNQKTNIDNNPTF